jgi:hypothetical protein
MRANRARRANAARTGRDTRPCQVPGCGETIRFVTITITGPFDEGNTSGYFRSRRVAVNVRPVMAGDKDADLGSIFVFGTGDGVPAESDAMRDEVLARGDKLYVEHSKTCVNPSWIKAKKASA